MIKQPENAPVWVDESRCKACDICVKCCPSGALAMKYDEHAIQGKMVEVIHPEYCIGCRDCETHCPDFAIYVADKGFKFAKLTPESKALAQKIKENKFMEVKEEECCK